MQVALRDRHGGLNDPRAVGQLNDGDPQLTLFVQMAKWQVPASCSGHSDVSSWSRSKWPLRTANLLSDFSLSPWTRNVHYFSAGGGRTVLSPCEKKAGAKPTWASLGTIHSVTATRELFSRRAAANALAPASWSASSAPPAET